MATAGVFETATVIVHGDHGSRIPLLMPSPRTAVRLSETDLIGSYATLFAIRTPELRAHRDPSLRSIQGLFAELDLSRPLPVETLDILVEAPGGRKIGQPFIQRTMPDFGD
jgi:hypothetical protein